MANLTGLYLENFRLFNKFKLSFEQKSIILGENATGKTSILESLIILLTSRSFRTTHLKECIKENEDCFILKAKGREGEEPFEVGAKKDFKSRLLVKRKPTEGARPARLLWVDVITAKTLQMIEGEPELRRDFFNRIMFHVKPEANVLNNEYKKILVQRNRALKKSLPEKEINVWTERLVLRGEELSSYQLSFFETFNLNLQKYLNKARLKYQVEFLSEIKLKFNPGWDDSKSLRESVKEAENKDLVLGYTTQGPHRADLIFLCNKRKASSFLSKGQQKLLILLIFLSLEDFLREHYNSSSLLLIDDACSELDEKNLTIIFEEILLYTNQVILTAINLESLGNLSNLKEFKQIKIPK